MISISAFSYITIAVSYNTPVVLQNTNYNLISSKKNAIVMVVEKPIYMNEKELVTHGNICDNIYFQNNAIEKMNEYNCDILATEKRIAETQQGIY